jgi:hypothetical protein
MGLMHGVEIFMQTLDFPEYASKRLCARADAKRDEDEEKSNTVVEVVQEVLHEEYATSLWAIPSQVSSW